MAREIQMWKFLQSLVLYADTVNRVGLERCSVCKRGDDRLGDHVQMRIQRQRVLPE